MEHAVMTQDDIDYLSATRPEINVEELSTLLDQELQLTNQRIGQLTENADSMNEEEFMEELQRLRANHYQTMEMCRRLYKWYGPSCEDDDADEHINSVSALTYDQAHKMGLDPQTGYLSRPPPAPKMSSKEAAAWRREENHLRDRNSENLMLSSDQVIRRKVREAWQRMEDREERQSRSLVRQSLRERPSSADRANHHLYQSSHDPHRASTGISRSSHKRGISSACGSRDDLMVTESQILDDADKYSWRHRVTIPEPFQMTLRAEKAAADASRKPKNRSMLQLERDMLEKAMREEEELRKKKYFRAKPIPANVYLPLFETLQEQARARREFVHKYNVELLKAQEKPFHFYIRELEKKRLEDTKSALMQSKTQKKVKDEMQKSHGSVTKAKPVPKTTYEDRSERLKEEQLLREISAKRRAEDLLKTAAEPGGMKERESMKLEKTKARLDQMEREQREAEAKAREVGKAKKVPNFDRLHQQFEAKRLESWKEPPNTKIKPFAFHTEIRSAERNVTKPPEQESQNNSTPIFKSKPPSRALFSAMEIAEPSTNNSTVLRDKKVKAKLDKYDAQEEEKEKSRLRKQRKEKEIHQTIRQKCDIVNPRKSVEMETTQRLRRLKENEFDRTRDYEERLAEMQKKVQQRPLLVEQYQASVAKQQAEKRYMKTLSAAGLQEEDLQREDNIVAYPQRHGKSGNTHSSKSNNRMEFGRPDDDNPRFPHQSSLDHYSDRHSEQAM